MKEIFKGEFEGGRVLIKNASDASKIHNKANVGRFKGGTLHLSLIEAYYLMSEKKLIIDPYQQEDFLKEAVCVEDDFEIRYLTYRDLRKRGFLIEDRGDRMVIWRGGEDRKYLLIPVYERVPFVFDYIYSLTLNSNIIFGVVDGDGDLTYYSIGHESPEGPIKNIFANKPQIYILGDVGITDDVNLHRSMYYGKIIDSKLYLSIIECLYLLEKGYVVLKGMREDNLKASELRDKALKKDPEFPQKLAIYSDLRDRGLIVKTGFKYGTHFRVYVRDVERHAPYLVHAVPSGYVGTWPEISRGVRLAHGVKKDFLLAEASDPPRYLKIKRVRL